jgi:ribose transport system permease protein
MAHGNSTLSKFGSAVIRGSLAWYGLPAALLFTLLFVVTGIMNPRFLSEGSLGGFLATYVPLACAAVGVSFAMLVAGIDLSVGSIIGFVNVMTVLFVGTGWSFWSVGPSGDLYTCGSPEACAGGWPFLVAAVAAVFAGTMFGALNGFAIAVLRLQPLLATLATGFVAGGLTLYFFPKPGGQVPGEVVTWYLTDWFIPKPAWGLLALIALGVLLLKSPLGVRMRAVGTHPWKAFVSNLGVGWARFWAYVFSAFCASVGGLLLTLNIASGDPGVGTSFTLSAIAGAVLGGAILAGGWAEPVGPALGALFFGLVGSFITTIGVPSFYQQLVSGLVVIAGLGLMQVLHRVRVPKASSTVPAESE